MSVNNKTNCPDSGVNFQSRLSDSVREPSVHSHTSTSVLKVKIQYPKHSPNVWAHETIAHTDGNGNVVFVFAVVEVNKSKK